MFNPNNLQLFTINLFTIMKKFLFVAITAVALMACGNGNDPDQPSGESKSKEQKALEYIGGKARATLYSPTDPVLQKMKDLGFKPYSETGFLAPRKAPKGRPGDVYRFFMNAPEVDGWIGIQTMSDKQKEAFEQVLKADKVYIEASLHSLDGVITSIDLQLRAKSELENVNNYAFALFQAAWDDFQIGGDEQFVSWRGSGEGGGLSPRYSSWPNMKVSFEKHHHVYAECEGQWLYPEKPSVSLPAEQYVYHHLISWTDDLTGLYEELPELPLVYCSFEADVYEYNPEEEAGEE